MNAQELTKALDKAISRIIELEKKVDFMEQEIDKLKLFKRDAEVDIKQHEYSIDMLKRWRG